ncbi:NAD(P)-dependent dehydrogenase (short-subunit alcohol dehydrogenase family) [Paenibacillus sp. V4I3]|uniref:oxidoreductase n=1 Tax=unclassified Paenibacillus TaxID=185978 RepID=UPI002780A72D|nr:MULTISPECIES: oxidoreductase [unclassified Paenibacillus]MDQ0872698.1 NAD(P)-dependent dehydrogenase (short-subunit alcohol dehydrogenase family) [Paenibacillus sp. V4I3]MDQ0891419.1 NAD(P)-dependent dehydrogenase (short-subunit alcohol dehydrogenase family) [Paenibacillus sp. V4I9]
MTNQKAWFITGAARGIGFEILKAVLETGDHVVATVRSSAESLADKLGNPENLQVVLLDITDEQQAIAAANQAVQKFGKIDVLVNNAGFGLLSAVEEATAEEVRKNFETNVFGLLNVTRAVLPHMRQRRSGHIINFSSVGGLSGYIGWGVYGATKFAVEGLTESLALELAPLGIHATVVAPGFFRTEFLDAASLTRSGNIIPDYAETVGEMRKFATQANKKQPGDPVKLAKAIVQVANAEKPPVHLPLGKDSLQRYREKTANFEKDIQAWHDVITGTDHDDV